MTVYIGVDFHARVQTVSYLTTEDGEIHQLELHHQNKDEVRAFYAQFTGEVIVGFETSGYAYWFEEMLEELGHQVWIGDAAEIRRLARRRQKNDRRDAELILQLLMSDRFPRLHRQSPESRLVLQQLRYRHRLVKMQTLVQNALKYMALSRGLSVRSKLTTHRGQELMLSVPFPEVLSQQRDQMVDLLRQLSAKIQPVQQWLERQAEQDIQVSRVMTHPGIGPLTGLCLVHTILPVDRFSNPRKVSAYVGFDPVEDSSADRRRMGSISKAGSRLLRFLLVEAGQMAVRRDQHLKHLYRRVHLRRNLQKAKVAVARHLLVRGFIMLRDEIDYDEFLRRGIAARSSRKEE
jgi:transposase